MDTSARLPDLYLEMLKEVLVRWGEDEHVPFKEEGSFGKKFIKRALNKRGILDTIKFDPEKRRLGRDWPARAKTMIGTQRLDNIKACVAAIIRDNIPGDLVETGVWRGGASIFMRAALEAYGDDERVVWCADSFQGLPTPNLQKYPQDKGTTWHLESALAVGVDVVKANFKQFNLLDDRVKFLEGWFKDTLPTAPIDKIAILRLDGDLYESTMDALNALHPKVSPGGFIIVDDYGLPEDTCRRAIHEFRDLSGITEPIIDIDGWGAYWRRSQS